MYSGVWEYIHICMCGSMCVRRKGVKEQAKALPVDGAKRNQEYPHKEKNTGVCVHVCLCVCVCVVYECTVAFFFFFIISVDVCVCVYKDTHIQNPLSVPLFFSLSKTHTFL